MSFPRIPLLIPVLGTLLVGLAGCQKPTTTTPSNLKKIQSETSDDLGRSLAVPVDVKRLVVIGPGAIETVYALGVGSKLVGRDSWADFPVEAKKLAVAGDYQGPSVEKCIALRPDLVIVQGETWDKARVEQWQKQIGAPVAALTATSIKSVQNDIIKMGAWLGAGEAGEKLAKSLNGTLVRGKKKAFVEVGRSPLFTAGQGTLVNDVLEAGGFINAVAPIKGYQGYSIESLLARQPDVFVSPSDKNSAQVLRELRATPTLSKLKCIREGRVIAIKGDYLLRPGPRLRLGIEQLQKEAAHLAKG